MNAAQKITGGLAVLALIAGFGIGKVATGSNPLHGSADGQSQSFESPLNSVQGQSPLGSRIPGSPGHAAIPAISTGVLAEEAAWLDKIASATLSNLAELFAEAEQINGDSLRSQIRQLLLTRWLDLDPEHAYAAMRLRIEAKGSKEKNHETLREFFGVWARVDLNAALAAAGALTDAEESKAAYQAIARARVDLDAPLAFLDLVKSLPKGAASGDLYASALTRLAEADRELALTEAVDLPWGPRIHSLNALYAQWSTYDPHAALEGTSKLFGIGVPIHDRAIAAVLPELAKADPDLAGERYNNLHAPNLNRGKVLYDIVNALAENDPVAAAEWLGAHGEKNYTHVIADTFNRTLLDDPATAVEIYNAIQPEEGSSNINVQMVGDPEALLGSLASLPDSFGKQQIQRGLISQWASRDFHAAAAFAENLPSATGPHLYRNPSDLNAAWNHAAAHRSELSDNTIHNLLRTIADSNPDLAIQKFQTLPAGDFRDSAGRSLTSTLAREDPFKAAEMINILPLGDLRDSAIRTVSNRLAADDPFTASEWIAELPAGNERDIATIELVNVVQDFDSQSAFIWATEIANENRRYQSLEKIVKTWAVNDPAAARIQIEAAAIPDSRKTKLLELLNSN